MHAKKKIQIVSTRTINWKRMANYSFVNKKSGSHTSEHNISTEGISHHTQTIYHNNTLNLTLFIQENGNKMANR